MLNRNFFIKELPGMTELMANTIQGLIEGVQYFMENGYKINHEASTAIGINYIVYGVKKIKGELEVKQDNQQIIELMEQVDFLEDELSATQDDLKKTKLDLKNSRTDCTKLKNKFKKEKRKK